MRRRLQISLRMFLLSLAALAVWLGWEANRLRRQAEAVRAFQRAGSIIGYRVPPPPGRPLDIALFAKEASWRDYFRTPTDLRLTSEAVDDELCRFLDDLPELKSLEFDDTGVTGASIERIGRLKRLEFIFLHDPDFTQDGVERLKTVVPPGCEIFSDYGVYRKPG
jgi:hypothetical protein